MFQRDFTTHFRVFPVVAIDQRNGASEAIMLPLTKDELRAAQVVGQSSKELIHRICAKQGYRVVSIGKPDKQALTLNAVKLCEWWDEQEAVRRKEDSLCFHGLRRDTPEVSAIED